jgi:hypothetical protein
VGVTGKDDRIHGRRVQREARELEVQVAQDKETHQALAVSPEAGLGSTRGVGSA